jgi:hypothetical protein
MKSLPTWFRPVAQSVALLIAAILIAGIVAVPVRFLHAPEGYEQPRIFENTKNTTRFGGGTVEAVAARISQAVYPATQPENTPSVVLLFDPKDWKTGLLAASFIKPLNAVLLPAGDAANQEIQRLNPSGSPALDNMKVVRLGSAFGPESAMVLDANGLNGWWQKLGLQPAHIILVDENDPQTALLAAPWAAYSGDRIVFQAGDAPPGLPLYVIGNEAAPQSAQRISGRDAPATATAFAKYQNTQDLTFGWGMNAETTTGYRAFTLALPDDPATALLSANLARRGKPGPLLWASERELPQVTNNYLWSQRAAFWVTPSEGPFHHIWVLGNRISFPAQAQADYALEIGPYLGKGVGMSGVDMLATAWVVLGLASAGWILFHEHKFLPKQNWIMRLAWPLAALLLGPFSIWFYILAYQRPVMKMGEHIMWDRPLWLQGLVATVSAVGFGATIMIATGFIANLFGLPLFPSSGPFFWLGSPMILVMILNYLLAVLISWPLFQTPMLSMFYGVSYRLALWKALPIVLLSMGVAAVAMNPSMWYFMMLHLPMMPKYSSILWFGIMFFTGFLAFLLAWPLNYLLVRQVRKSGLM